MESNIDDDFRKLLNRLPVSVQRKARKSYALWRNDPYHRSLRFKIVSQRQPIYSVRIGSNYRALSLLEDNCVYWFWIGSHARYDEILKRF